ncbi:uncharacterized protein Dwil_GK19048 [Drosophila willistoni]|uniref:Uncharacterized protein n=1 Tax=Drosophila willistoni TaxID=7260 RepID=B4MW74_DROWI|nr:uncharacterized protein LOC6642269 [Drosophila willistoni]EDW75944.2 uncharacterized protein Dwil_GK19048 [Drosophila willistoni]
MWCLIFILAALHSASTAPFNTITLEMDIIKEMAEAIADILYKQIDLFERVIEDAELLLPADTTSQFLNEIEIFLDTAHHILKAIENSEELDSIEDTIEELFDFLDLDDSNEADKLIDRLLEQYGLIEFEQYQEERLSRAFHRIEQHVEIYLDRLTDEKLKRHSDVLEWFLNFQNEKDIEKKLSIAMDVDFN